MQRQISIHAPRTGSDVSPIHLRTRIMDFNPRSPHGERLCRGGFHLPLLHISIHAPRTGSDVRGCAGGEVVGISIHAPRTGSDLENLVPQCRASLFQSTLPARGATLRLRNASKSWRFQSTLPARGATLCGAWWTGSIQNPISIHAPRTGSDALHAYNDALQQAISIHAPRTGSDEKKVAVVRRGIISIHAPRTGSDYTGTGGRKCHNYFNPRSPHGERPAPADTRARAADFNPRSPHGERRT